MLKLSRARNVKCGNQTVWSLAQMDAAQGVTGSDRGDRIKER